MLRQHAAREGFNLAESDRLKAACPLKAKAKTADAAEKVQHAKLVHESPPWIKNRFSSPSIRSSSGGKAIMAGSCGISVIRSR